LGDVLAPVAADPLERDRVLAALRTVSLVTRHPETHTLTLHRLVQAVVRDHLDPTLVQVWRRRALVMVNAAFPSVSFATWSQCERYLPHALACVPYGDQESPPPPEAMELLVKVGSYLLERWRLPEAKSYLVHAIALYEALHGPDSPMLIPVLLRMCELVRVSDMALANTGETAEQAERLVQRTLALCEQHLGANHVQTAAALTEVGAWYREQGKIREAESVLQRALAIRERELGPEHLQTAKTLEWLAVLLYDQAKYAQAVPLCQRVLAIRERELGPDHPDTVDSVCYLGAMYRHEGQYAEAKALLQRGLAMQEQQIEEWHPGLAYVLNHLCLLALATGDDEQALALGERSLRLREERLKTGHPLVATSLTTLARVYRAQGRRDEAESLLQRALVICEQQWGRDHFRTADVLAELALLAQRQGKGDYAEAV
jgi:tetratricopeptide (TPR) repeat protein